MMLLSSASDDDDDISRKLSVTNNTLLLYSCPPVTMLPWKQGVLLQPQTGPPGLLLLWLPHKSSQLQVYIYIDH